jgi:hypothetical protein
MISAGFGEPIDAPLYMWNFYIIPLTSLFYSYAVWLKKDEKDRNRVTLYLLGITAIFLLIIGAIKIELIMPFIFLALCIPFLFGFYAGYFVTYRTLPSLRFFAWTPMLIIVSIGFFLLFSMLSNRFIDILRIPGVFLVTTFLSLFIGPFLVPFIIVCLIGSVHKRLTKKKNPDETLNNSDSNRNNETDSIKEDHDETSNNSDLNHDDTTDSIKEDHDETSNNSDSNHNNETDSIKEGHGETSNNSDLNHENTTDLIKEDHDETSNNPDSNLDEAADLIKEDHDEASNILDSNHDDTTGFIKESHDEMPNILDSNHDDAAEK